MAPKTLPSKVSPRDKSAKSLDKRPDVISGGVTYEVVWYPHRDAPSLTPPAPSRLYGRAVFIYDFKRHDRDFERLEHGLHITRRERWRCCR